MVSAEKVKKPEPKLFACRKRFKHLGEHTLLPILALLIAMKNFRIEGSTKGLCLAISAAGLR
jgi:hypothetical protein